VIALLYTASGRRETNPFFHLRFIHETWKILVKRADSQPSFSRLISPLLDLENF
jgi:hypothetical protein